MKRLIFLCTILVAVACQKGESNSLVLDDRVSETGQVSIKCTDQQGKVIFSVKDQNVVLFDKHDFYASAYDFDDQMLGAGLTGIKQYADGNTLHVKGEIVLHNFDVEMLAVINKRAKNVIVSLLDTDDGDEDEYALRCDQLELSGLPAAPKAPAQLLCNDDSGQLLYAIAGKRMLLYDEYEFYAPYLPGSEDLMLEGGVNSFSSEAGIYEIEAEIEMMNFEVITTAKVHVAEKKIDIRLYDTDDGDVDEYSYQCAELKIITDPVVIKVNNDLKNAELKNMIYKRIMQLYYHEDDGYERSIDKDKLAFKISEITKTISSGSDLLAMKVTARGSAYSSWDNYVVDWNCQTELDKIAGEWSISDTECTLEPEND